MTGRYFFLIYLINQLNSKVSLHQFSSVQFSRSVVSNSLRPHELQHARPPVHHQLPEFTQTHIHRVRDAIQPSHLLSSPSPPAPDPYTYHNVLKFFVSCDKIFFFLKLNFIVVYTTFSSSIYQMDREAWHAVIHGVAKSRTRLSD